MRLDSFDGLSGERIHLPDDVLAEARVFFPGALDLLDHLGGAALDAREADDDRNRLWNLHLGDLRRDSSSEEHELGVRREGVVDSRRRTTGDLLTFVGDGVDRLVPEAMLRQATCEELPQRAFHHGPQRAMARSEAFVVNTEVM